jgi:hypothetical protein
MKHANQNMVYAALFALALWLVFSSKPKKEKCCGMPA